MTAIKGRKLSVENAVLIGQGFYSDVYLLDDGNVVKVLKNSSFEDADKEIQLSKWALKKGVPTAISYDVADVDGHPGLVYESLGRDNLRNVLRDTPERFDEVLSRYTELLRTVNSIEVEPGQLPNTMDKYKDFLERARPAMSDAEYERMKQLLGTIPESRKLLHGDFHVKNIKVVRGELLLIDLDTLSCGDPIFELSGLYRSYNLFLRKDIDSDVNAFFELDKSILLRLLDGLLRGYFPGLGETALRDNRRKIELLSSMFMLYWYLDVEPERTDQLEAMLALFRELLPQCDTLALQYSEE